MKRNLRFKLLAGFVLVAMFTGALGSYSVATMQQLNDGQRTLFGDVFGGTHLLARYVDGSLSKKHSVGAALEAAAAASFDYTRNVAVVFSVASAGLGLLLGLLLSGRIARAVGQVARAAQGLARGDLNQRITIRSSDEIGAMATAFREMIGYQQEMARVANAIAVGDLTQDVTPKSNVDVLGIAFGRMTRNLCEQVGQLEQAIPRANRLLEKNRRLHERVRQAARRTTALNEQALRRIGADLHDGPCQALALTLLRIETLRERVALG